MNNMFANMSTNFTNHLFVPIENVVWDIMSGNSMSILTKNDTIASLLISPVDPNDPESKEEHNVSLNPFASMAMAIPAFGRRVPYGDVKIGDIYTDGKQAVGWVVGKNEKTGSLAIHKVSGAVQNVKPPKLNIGGMTDGVMIVSSLMQTTGSAQGAGDFQNSMMQMMMYQNMFAGKNKSKEFDMQSMIPMMLTMSQTGQPGGINNMMQTMMLMKQMENMQHMMGNGNPNKNF